MAGLRFVLHARLSYGNDKTLTTALLSSAKKIHFLNFHSKIFVFTRLLCRNHNCVNNFHPDEKFLHEKIAIYGCMNHAVIVNILANSWFDV